ncbi:MAG TPA: chemotaxis protein CheX [Petrotogaceae bacterium]|nr:chemotaxis protein CheX [Petrotogaceae bacterium]
MLDVKIINATMDALKVAFVTAAKTDFKVQKPLMVKEVERIYDVITVIGFNGAIDGNLVYAVKREGAIIIVNNMMSGMLEINSLDEMALSAISELGNMVSGSIAMSLEKIGYSINITPPSVITGKDLQVLSEGTILKFPGIIHDETEMGVFLAMKT